MRAFSVAKYAHRRGPIPTGVDAYHAGKGAMEINRLGYQKTDGIYTVKATAKDGTGQAYCDMTTDGGGWMLVARTHPSSDITGIPWGWYQVGTGGLTDFTRPYSIGWKNWHDAGARFTEFIYGNRKNINNNQWGPFIYRKSNFSWINARGYDGVFADNSAGNTPSAILKWDFSIYNYGDIPSMQSLWGFMKDANYQTYWMRDVIGNGNLNYGLQPNGFLTTYINNTDPAIIGGNGWQLSGPWAIAGTSYNATTGDFNQTDGSGNNHYGGTTQAMLMVRNSAAAL